VFAITYNAACLSGLSYFSMRQTKSDFVEAKLQPMLIVVMTYEPH